MPRHYPPNWDKIRFATYAGASWRCEHCGEQFTPGSTKHPEITNADGRPLILTVHHLDRDTTNNHWTNLLCCCQRCHLSIQAAWRPGWPLPWPEPPAWIIRRKLPYMVQLSLL